MAVFWPLTGHALVSLSHTAFGQTTRKDIEGTKMPVVKPNPKRTNHPVTSQSEPLTVALINPSGNTLLPDYIRQYASERALTVTQTTDIPSDAALCLLCAQDLKQSLDLLGASKDKPVTRSIPVLVTLAQPDHEAIRQLLEAGAWDYLPLPTDELSRLELKVKLDHALELARCRRDQAQPDPLTGLYNRSFLETNLHRLDTERQLPLSIVVGDIDGLSLINDTLGPVQGDRALLAVSDLMRSCCRHEDLVGRWSGDAFMILLPQADQDIAEQVVARIQDAIGNHTAQDLMIPLSMSWGIAVKTDIDQPVSDILRQASEDMQLNKLLAHRSWRYNLIRALNQILTEKSGETSSHVQRMARIALRVGKMISLDKHELDSLCLLAILHDIGKVIVPDNILNKPGSLNDAEWKQVRRHPEIGCRIISGISELEPVALGILTHHEHWNGRGYPQGLSGESIPLIARLVSIIDAYDAMTHDRPYHRAMTPQEALTELKRCAGSQFDPDLITKFIQAWHENPRDFSPV